MAENQPTIFEIVKRVGEQLSALPEDLQARVLHSVADLLGIKTIDSSTLRTPAQHTTPPIASPPPVPPNQPKDIRTFLNEKQPKSDNQYAAAVAYYYQFEAPEQDRLDVISADTLQEAARLAGRTRLGNPAATLNNATSQGYLDRVEPGQFKVSTVGENLVAMTLPSKGDGSTATVKKRSPRKKKTTTAKKRTAKKKTRKKK